MTGRKPVDERAGSGNIGDRRAEVATPGTPARSLAEDVKQPLDDLQHKDQESEDLIHPLALRLSGAGGGHSAAPTAGPL